MAWMTKTASRPSYGRYHGTYALDYGYGPFRWVCLSGKHEDLIATDHAAMEAIQRTLPRP